jgi:hypothetical protein
MVEPIQRPVHSRPPSFGARFLLIGNRKLTLTDIPFSPKRLVIAVATPANRT